MSAAAEREYKDLPKDVQDDFGKDLRRIQYGQDPERPIKSLTESVGAGAIELIINGSPAFRCVYVAKFADMVVVLHSFIKTTNRSDRHAAGRRTADEGVECGFHDTWTLSPRSFGHSFHAHLDT
ncbi:type II toxin-antitoxin system RelE/ParE family toxin [Pseudomonas sp. XWY-1]|uniref:type II toxin-antitoxin system RelE/ParE family toxin n=1 Tax=Pseudomonas sp. XWY-1 TaxID=2069256 RepID=UPI0021147092|nr:type II toxin-antitoxin system RelE/ParE family toxin [Pseudomonas sp. XWY-1]